MLGREGEEEDGRNGTMKTLGHRETEDASGDAADRRSREKPGRRKDWWQSGEQGRPTESLALSARCLTQLKGHSSLSSEGLCSPWCGIELKNIGPEWGQTAAWD